MTHRAYFVPLIAATLLLAAPTVGCRRAPTAAPTPPSSTSSTSPSAAPRPADAPAASPVVARPAVTPAAAPALTEPGTDATGIEVEPLARVPEQYRAQVQSVVEAQRTGKHPERLSPLIAANRFDAAAWKRDPSAYLDVVEPARVYDTARATGPESVRLRADSPEYRSIPYRGTAPLAVVGAPGAPVTFTALDGGYFDNHLASITLRADGAGRAAVTYHAGDGAGAAAQVLAGSPLTVGTVAFILQIGPTGGSPSVESAPVSPR